MFGLALQVKLLDSWRAGGDSAPGTALVHPEGDAEWVPPYRIAEFPAWFTTLLHWKRFAPSAVAPGCRLLCEFGVAKPRFALTDERCPVLTIVDALEKRGWHGENRLVEHRDAGTLTFDGRRCPRMRFYYTLLLLTSKCHSVVGGARSFAGAGRLLQAPPQGCSRGAGSGQCVVPQASQQKPRCPWQRGFAFAAH